MGLIVAYGQFLPGGKEDALHTYSALLEGPVRLQDSCPHLPPRAPGAWLICPAEPSLDEKGQVRSKGLPCLWVWLLRCQPRGRGGIAHLTASAQELLPWAGIGGTVPAGPSPSATMAQGRGLGGAGSRWVSQTLPVGPQLPVSTADLAQPQALLS